MNEVVVVDALLADQLIERSVSVTQVVSLNLMIDLVDALCSQVFNEASILFTHLLLSEDLFSSVVVLLVTVLDLLLVKTLKLLLQHDPHDFAVAGDDGVELFFLLVLTLNRLD